MSAWVGGSLRKPAAVKADAGGQVVLRFSPRHRDWYVTCSVCPDLALGAGEHGVMWAKAQQHAVSPEHLQRQAAARGAGS